MLKNRPNKSEKFAFSKTILRNVCDFQKLQTALQAFKTMWPMQPVHGEHRLRSWRRGLPMPVKVGEVPEKCRRSAGEARCNVIWDAGENHCNLQPNLLIYSLSRVFVQQLALSRAQANRLGYCPPMLGETLCVLRAAYRSASKLQSPALDLKQFRAENKAFHCAADCARPCRLLFF